MTILAISGSLRKSSYNTALALSLSELVPEGMAVTVADIAGIPLYNGDIEAAAFPPPAQAFKDAILAADAIVIATPEYNRSVPGVLKNAIDWASRPYGKNAFARKPVLVTGVSTGKIGTAIAQNHLRGILLYLDAQVLGQPELYLGPAKEIFDEEGNLADEPTRERLREALTALASRLSA